ncbi:Retrovirus-related Pol polyprotein from transposon RE1 [Vitis vinifera]|uniref:Retrovirus-related Pol polyprotein from transposon RE1 n=1 Tax=Vitis vinifera TaxID=29760 RepID=A0A438E7S2_VITVI|nr:Retrovirus-related Pol polyprotein from transposon RE1 [Vitis vinifera]
MFEIVDDTNTAQTQVTDNVNPPSTADLSRTTNKDTIWVNSGNSEYTALNNEEIEKLKNLLRTLENPSNACFLTQSMTGNDLMEMERLKEKLATEFETKDLGPLCYFLRMEVARNKSGISVSQRKYILDLLKETRMPGCKPVDTPIDLVKKIGEQKESTPVDTGRYQLLVGKLIYLSHSRSDIAFAVSVVSQYMHAPCEEHVKTVYRILNYLKGSLGKGLYFRKNETRSIEGFTNAN